MPSAVYHEAVGGGRNHRPTGGEPAMSESVNVTLPPGVAALGDALRPLRLKLQAQMDAPVRRDLPVVDLAGEIEDHLDELEDTVSGLVAKVNALGELLARERPVAGIHRGVGGLEVYVDTLLERYSEVRRWRPGASEAAARDSLAGVYRHVLTEIRDWMDELIEAIDDPLAAVKRRGLPTSGKVHLRFDLTLTEALELASLRDWLDSNLPGAGDYGSRSAPAEKQGLGFLGTVAAAALGFGIGSWLFGGEGEE